MGPEAKIEDYFVQQVKRMKGRVRKVRWLDRRGAPDRLVWFPIKLAMPVIYFVELKSKNGKLSPLQKREISKLRNDEFSVRVLTSKEDVDLFIEEAFAVIKRRYEKMSNAIRSAR